MKNPPKIHQRGFTLIELSVALMMGILTGSMVLALTNQQLAFLRIYRTQNFLSEEAPVINAHVSRLLGRADRFRLHDSMNDALAGSNPRLGPSPVLVMNFRQPDGSLRAAILSFEDRGQGKQLYYYLVPQTGVLSGPQWSVTDKPANVAFTIDQGILRMTLTGTAGEQIIYSGTMQL